MAALGSSEWNTCRARPGSKNSGGGGLTILSLGLLLGLLVLADVGEGESGLDVKRSTSDWTAFDRVGILDRGGGSSDAIGLCWIGRVLLSTGACDWADSWYVGGWDGGLVVSERSLPRGDRLVRSDTVEIWVR